MASWRALATALLRLANLPPFSVRTRSIQVNAIVKALVPRIARLARTDLVIACEVMDGGVGGYRP